MDSSLDKCNRNCNVLSPKYVFRKTQDINVKVFNVTRNKNEAKNMAIHNLCDSNSIVQYVIQIDNGIIKHVNLSVKIIVHAKKIIVGFLEHVFVRIASI